MKLEGVRETKQTVGWGYAILAWSTDIHLEKKPSKKPIVSILLHLLINSQRDEPV